MKEKRKNGCNILIMTFTNLEKYVYFKKCLKQRRQPPPPPPNPSNHSTGVSVWSPEPPEIEPITSCLTAHRSKLANAITLLT